MSAQKRNLAIHAPRTRASRATALIAASAATAGCLAALPAQSLAAPRISVGAGGTSIVIDGQEISTSHLTVAQLAADQGVPPTTVTAELEGVTTGTPYAAVVDSLLSTLASDTPLSTVLSDVSGASGGTITPASLLEQVVADEGQASTSTGTGSQGGGGAPGSPGAAGSPGTAGSPGAPGAAATPGASGGTGSNGSSTPGQTTTTATGLRLHLISGSLRGRPDKRVKVRFTISTNAKITYDGAHLAHGSRKFGPGKTDTLTMIMPRKAGVYKLKLKAVAVTGAKQAQTTETLRVVRKASKHRANKR